MEVFVVLQSIGIDVQYCQKDVEHVLLITSATLAIKTRKIHAEHDTKC